MTSIYTSSKPADERAGVIPSDHRQPHRTAAAARLANGLLLDFVEIEELTLGRVANQLLG